MSAPSPKLAAALAFAIVYVIAAASIVRAERHHQGGGFITLQGMGSYLVTLPISLPFEFAGHKLDFRNNWQMGAAIGACALLVGGLGLGLISLLAHIPWFHGAAA